NTVRHAVITGPNAGGDFPARAEARVERAIQVKPRQRKRRATAARLSHGDDPAISLHGQRMHLSGPDAEVRRRLAAGKDDIQIAGIEHEAIFQMLDRRSPLWGSQNVSRRARRERRAARPGSLFSNVLCVLCVPYEKLLEEETQHGCTSKLSGTARRLSAA